MQKSVKMNQADPYGKRRERSVSEFGTSITSGRSAYTYHKSFLGSYYSP